MKWMLIVMVMGDSPVKTNLLFDTLDECLSAEDTMRNDYAIAFNKWLAWAKANPVDSGFPGTQKFMERRMGLDSKGTCVPHGPISD